MVIIILLAAELDARAVMAQAAPLLLVRAGIDRVINHLLPAEQDQQLWGHGKNIPNPKHRGQKPMDGVE